MSRLIEALRRGDPEAESEVTLLVRRFARSLCRPSGSLAGIPEIDWEDVAQEACRQLYGAGLGQFRGRGPERSYLFSIVKASLIHMLRGARRRQRREQSAMHNSPPTSSGPERRLDIRRVLAALDESCRQLIERAILRDESYADLASAMGLAESSVRSKLSRCLARARAIASGKVK